jgi:tRNA A37 threonylcarbamoyladenosine dehydratase
LIDLDVVAESNLNRQAHATFANLGRDKVLAMRERIASFAPDCVVNTVDDFVTPENVAQLISPGLSFVIDAIDQVRAKAALVAHCKAQQTSLVICGGAGGKTDPTTIRRADLTLTKNDALLSKLRANLRRDYGFPRGEKKFGVMAIYSEAVQRGARSEDGGAGLSCAGYGSAMQMTAPLGLAAAAYVIESIAQSK